jgi:integrase
VARKAWRYNGRRIGSVVNGTFHVCRSINGREYRFSTKCVSAEAAVAVYQRFERDPAGFVLGRSDSVDFTTVVKEYLVYSELTKQNSTGHVKKQAGYFANLGASGLFPNIQTFISSDVRAYMAWRAGGGVDNRQVGPPAVNRDLAALKGLMTWARLEKKTSNIEDTLVPLVKEDHGKNVPHPIPKKHWMKILDQLLPKWSAACEVMLGAGLRYGEVARISSADIMASGIAVPKAKGRKARIVPCSAATVASARAMLKAGGVPDDEAGQLDHRLAVACDALGCPHYTAHEWRHTYATECLKSGVDLRDLQARLGHASVTTTEKYLHVVRAMDRKPVIGAPR